MPDEAEQVALALAKDAALAGALFAVSPFDLGGVVLRGRTGVTETAWLDALGALLPTTRTLRRLPTHITDDRLIGGLDLATTLAAGRPVVERGVLACADGHVLLIPSAERLPVMTAAVIVSAMDKREIVIERDGIARRFPTAFGVVALDEGIGEEESLPSALSDRLAFHIDADAIGNSGIQSAVTRERVGEAEALYPAVSIDTDSLAALCQVAAALGIGSLNGPLLAARAARCHASLHGRAAVKEDDVAAAARLVLSPRATMLPVIEDQEPEDETAPEETDRSEEDRQRGEGELEDVVLAAAQAAIPPDLLARLAAGGQTRSRGSGTTGSGSRQKAVRRGRPAGTKRGGLRAGARLNLLETLRAAAPWQRLRARGDADAHGGRRVEVRPDDFRVRRLKDRRETVTVFVVDASGSSALHRLAEAKGAVELLLADCYVRRDQVALLSFGGRGVELLLPPTRSLTRARRCLADLPGGGGTPLAAALEQAGALVEAIMRRHQTPAVVLLTDGRANLSRGGQKGRAAAEADAMLAAGALRECGASTLLIDTSPRAAPSAERIAEAMGAQYVPLPYADAQSVSHEVKVRLGSQQRPGGPR